jgi:hypothetical protein
VVLEVGGIEKKPYICTMKNNKVILAVVGWFILITIVAFLVS